MSEAQTPIDPAAAPVPAAPEPVPVPVPEPVATPTPEPAPAPETPAAEPSPADAPAEPAKPAAHTDTPTALEEFTKPKEGEEPPAAAATPSAPAATPEPVAYELTVPEGVQLDEARMTEFRGFLGQHQMSAEVAQPLLDMHIDAMTRYAEQLREDQHRVFADTRKGWREQIMGDEELGGSGYETTMRAAARMRDLLVPESRRAAFDDMLRHTGVGDHPEFIRILHNAARLYDEPAIPAVTPQPTPQPGGRGSRAGVMYDHPASRKAAGR